MLIQLPDTIKDLYFVGDVHAGWNIVTYYIRQYKIKDSVFIFCGDVGIGFESLMHYANCVVPQLHKTLKKFNDIFIWVRGNHKYFKLICFSHK
jgi:hypothetical protein